MIFESTLTDFPLPWQKCKEGAEYCLENANRILEDSVTLFADKRYITSSFLAIFAIEEIGKGAQLLELFKTKIDLTKSKWRKLRKGRYSHIRKIKTGQNLAHKYLRKMLRNLPKDILAEWSEKAKEFWAKHYQWRKEQYLYVGLENGIWVSPIRKSIISQVTFAGMELSEAFEAYIELARELGKDITGFEKRYQAFNTSLSREWVKFLPDEQQLDET